MSTYKVELLPTLATGGRNIMWRAGRQFVVKQPQILELTADEVKVFENDDRFTITDSKNTGQTVAGGTASKGGSIPQSSDTETEETDIDATETETNTVAPSEEEISSEVEGDLSEDTLLKFSRTDLNQKAIEVGVENPEGLANKTEVVQAILDTQ